MKIVPSTARIATSLLPLLVLVAAAAKTGDAKRT
jgi:hypothetical protein